ncbi:hypothetical protein HCN44_004910 [Aphidius gifuensis]|uniref:Uncharacterized protein n=1 Tax=Aphidius gifuensis TaxID=684658 RepID=A0A834XXF0_APHGI|nr:unconventional myosin-Ie-like [Aphidius gifuensis]KAF7992566.1 hypothetical protein HCN44_004910 [Aphidius gifuensis]
MVHHWQSHNVKVSGVDDMVLLPKITEDAITENLRKRYMDDYIFTCIGPVLVSINPFKQMPYFGEKEISLYQGAAPYENPPHIYGLADDMYRNMLIDVESQCVIISGESGAGKTVAAKYIMAYVSRVSGGGERVQKIKDIILESNPLLEAFGNAKTIRNNNSSRFGKYVEMQFGNGGQPTGGKITNFLLEKSRVVRHNNNERNFHIFYQLVSGANEQMKSKFGLKHELQSCDYLKNYDGNISRQQIEPSDAKDFQETLKAMSVMGINENQVSDILKIVAGILHIGNIAFQENGNYSKISNTKSLELPSLLLGISAERLSRKLTSREFESKWGSQSESVDLTLNVSQALYTRDALAKDIYTRLFDYLVKRVNIAMESTGESFEIAILDIYGFEIFETNGFEQFCINFVNEKLQQIFIELTLKAEQEEYISENIKWTPINYFNNSIVVELLEGKRPPGLFLILDDVCATLHGGSDDADLNLKKKIENNSSKHEHYQCTIDGFSILHYAGQVTYCVDGFCDKNRDVLFQDLIDLMQNSNNKLINILYPIDNNDLNNKNKYKTLKSTRPTTAGNKIRNQASKLVSQLMKCTPHYIRCIKPNETKKSKDWDQLRVKHQIEYLGLKENIRVRRAGFAYRRLFVKFLQRYAILTKETWPIWNGDEKIGIKLIMSSIFIGSSQYQLGTTKIFIKAPETLFTLEEHRERKFNYYACIIQRTFKKYYTCKRQYNEKLIASDILYGHKQRRKLSIERNFIGDYIGVNGRPGLINIIGRREKIYYSEIVKKYDRRFKICRRDLILTDNYIYLIGRAVIKNNNTNNKLNKPGFKKTEEIIKRKISFDQISHISLSTLQDDFICIHIKDDYDSLLQLIFKTEFLSVLNKKYYEKIFYKLNIKFTNNIEFKIKKNGWGGGGTRQVKFVETNIGDNEILKINNKILTVTIGSGLPSITKPTRLIINHKKNLNNNNSHLPRYENTQYIKSQVSSDPTPTPRTIINRPDLPPNRPTSIRQNLHANNYVKINQNIRENIDKQNERPKSNVVRAPPPPSDPAPPNQPVVNSAYTNNKKFNNNSNISNQSSGYNQKNNKQFNDTNQLLAATINLNQNRQVPSINTKPSLPKLQKVISLYDYHAQDLDELELKEGDIFEVIKEYDGGWWQGRLRGKLGLFPSNYVQKM